MYDLHAYLRMMRDPVRMPAYEAAIRATVRPGDVVLDLGAGAGVMSFLALGAGASRVYALDPNEAIGVAREVARANGLADRVRCLRADSTRVELPEPAGVLVADVRGTLPLVADSLRVVADARRRHLKPGGLVIPREDRIQLAPVECAEAFVAVDGWRAAWGGTDYAGVAALAANRWTRHAMKPEWLLAPARSLPPLRYDADPPSELSLAAEFLAGRDGLMHGLAAWFETELAPGIGFSTGPGGAETVYGHAFFPLERPRALRAGEALAVRFSVRPGAGEPVWSWSVGAPGAAESHSTFEGAVLDPGALRGRAASSCPRLGDEGELDRFALSLVDGERSLGEIARAMAARFPERFARWEEALGHAGALAERYAPAAWPARGEEGHAP